MFARQEKHPVPVGGSAEARFRLGIAFLERRETDAAIDQFHQAVLLQPDWAEAYFNLGIAFQDQQRLCEATTSYQQALRCCPDLAEAHYNLGLVLQDQGRLDEAIGAYRRALELRPDFPAGWNNLGTALQDEGDHEQAVGCFERALALRPDYADAHYNLGCIRHRQSRIDTAMDHYRRAIELSPHHHKARNNIGKAYQDCREVDRAIACYREALSIKPDYAEARFNLATALLLRGDFAEGWTHYEARWATRDWKRMYPRRFAEPVWDGSPLDGKSILVHSEQGLGDVFQFARYLPMVKERGGAVVFETRTALIELFRNWEGVDMLVPLAPDKEPAVDFDVYAPLLSLPGIFKTAMGSIPQRVPYIAADPEKTLQWAGRLAGNELRVGLVWAGTATDPHRASPLAWFAPLSTIPGIRIFGLQKGPAVDLLQREGLPPGMSMENIGGEFGDFSDTAAAIAHLDLVVSIDTSVAHLAGAMGKPVYLLLPDVPDWRWMLDREDSPWYPTMRLFRQQTPGDWGPPLTRIGRRLETLAQGLKLALSAPDGSGLTAAAAHFHKQGERIEALLFYDRLLRTQPDHPDGLHGSGLLAYQAGNHSRAIALIERAVALSPDTDRYHYHLGLAHMALEHYEAASQAFYRAHCINPDWADALANLQVALRRLQELQKTR
jgi:tetratricopeptide (TPR) repeat protein